MLACLNYVHQAHMLPFQLCRLKNEVRVRRLLPAHYLSGSCNSARFWLLGCQVNLHIQRFSQRWECSAGMGMLKGWVLAQGKPCGHQMGLLLVMVLSEHGCETQKGSTGFLAPKGGAHCLAPWRRGVGTVGTR